MEDRLSKQMGQAKMMEDARAAAEAKIQTFTRLRSEFVPIINKFEVRQEDADLELFEYFVSDEDPVMAYVEMQYGEDGGPARLAQYRKLSSEMEAAARRAQPRSDHMMPWPCKHDCVQCVSEPSYLAGDYESICPHALLERGEQKRALSLPPAAAGLSPTHPNRATVVHVGSDTAVSTALVATTAAAVIAAPAAAVSPVAAQSLVPAPSTSTALIAAPPPVPTPPEIGSDEWKELPEADRIRSLRTLYDALGLTGLTVCGMLRNYLDKIAPLERTYHHGVTRGHSYRGGRFAGKQLQSLWSERLSTRYEPVLCRVVEYMDTSESVNNVWEAANAIEEKREESGGDWSK